MNNIATIIVFGIMCILGGGSSLYVLISLPVVLIQKIIGKIRFGEPIM